MLSSEPDPPCCSSEEIVVLKSSSCNNSNNNNNNITSTSGGDDDGNKVVGVEASAVDLLNSDHDKNYPFHKFSIRDYVFNRRGENIETHWPFSAENLQLCMKHGVKDVLPPFQTLDSLRNPSTVKSAVVGSISESHVKLSRLSNDHNLLVSSNDADQNLPLDTENINLSGSEEDKEHSSTTKNKSCSDSTIKSCSLEPEAENSRKKAESTIRNPVKKCKVIVKVNNVVVTKSKEEVSETMASSKVCPVCKTFSSSSNTTLNAHIDQCLSGESTPKMNTADPKVAVKHKIKARKTRMMVDIYQAALHCTLEDLDRRNGTNWASNLSFPTPDLAEEKDKDKTFASENQLEESAVYVDSNGTKLRILSKFRDPLSSSSAKDDSCGSRKPVESEKGSKFISSKKKKDLVQKHNFLPNRPHGKRTCSPKSDHHSEVNNGEQRESPPEKDFGKEDLSQPLKDCDGMKADGFGMIKSWVVSKRTGLKKKINPEHESQHRGKVIARSRDLTFSSDENSRLPIENRKRKENSSSNVHGEYMEEQPRLRKRARISVSESRGVHDNNKNGMVHEHYSTHSSKGTEKHASSQSSKKKRISIGSTINNDISLISSRGNEFKSVKKTSLDPGILSEGKRFSSLKKNLGRKHLDLKKRKLRYMSESDEEVAEVEKPSDQSLSNKYRDLKTRKKNGVFVKSAKEGEIALKGSEKSPKSNVDSFTGCNVPADTPNIQAAAEEVEIHEEFVSEPQTTNVANDGEAFVAFTKSLDSQIEMFCKDIAAENLVTSNPHMVAEIGVNNEGQGNYFDDVDPIPIPGPPGSFLPSPGRMGSEELQGHSSLTSCRIHSSEDDGHELVEMDSSDSPISTTSAVSNSMQAQRRFSENRIDRVAESSNPSEGKQKVDDEPRGNSVFSDTSSQRMKNSQPCCCSRKEDVLLQSGSLNYQDSQLLRRRTVTALPSEKFPEKLRAPQLEKVVVNSPRGFCDQSPSPSTPVLRLMGKNLMVVNNEENHLLSPQTKRPAESSMVNEYANNNYSFHHSLPRDPPPVFDNMQTCIQRQSFGGSSSIHENNYFRTQEYVSPSKSFGGNGSRFGISNNRLEGEKARNPPPPPGKEIIVIDDSPEDDENMGAFRSRNGISGSGYETRRVIGPINGFPTPYYHPIHSGSHMVNNANNIQMLPPPSNGGMNARWNYTGEGSRTPHPNSASLPQGPTGQHPKSSLLYFPHDFH